MNPGGEPDRDDTGLPPVDIEIPDDARELDRDVHAYYREVRAQRRRRRFDRWHASLARDGIVLPLLACCLILALIAGTLLTVFSAASSPTLTPTGPSGADSAARSASPSASQPAAGQAVPMSRLPDATITVAGQPVRVRTLRSTALVLVAPGCACRSMLAWLTEIAAKVQAGTYLIATPATEREVSQLYGQLDSDLRADVTLATETDGKLQTPALAGHFAAILIGPQRQASYVTDVDPPADTADIMRALSG